MMYITYEIYRAQSFSIAKQSNIDPHTHNQTYTTTLQCGVGALILPPITKTAISNAKT